MTTQNLSRSIQIDQTVMSDMVDHAKAILPNESCGYLAGTEDRITTLYKMTNIDASPEHFSFDPKEQFAVLKAARAEGLVLKGVYHSHPESPARLSEEDLRLLNDPNMVYVIVSLMNNKPDVKAFQIEKTDNLIDVTQVTIQTEGG